MSEWITDRKPKKKDAYKGSVWLCRKDGYVYDVRWEHVMLGEPWMPITPPEPYVKPRRWNAVWAEFRGVWMLHDTNSGATICLCTDNMNVGLNEDTDEHRTAAEEIAAIYERIMPW